MKYVFIENHQAVVDRKAETSQNLHHLIAFVAKANKLAPPIWMFFDQQIARRIVFDIVDRNARLQGFLCRALVATQQVQQHFPPDTLRRPSSGLLSAQTGYGRLSDSHGLRDGSRRALARCNGSFQECLQIGVGREIVCLLRCFALLGHSRLLD